MILITMVASRKINPGSTGIERMPECLLETLEFNLQRAAVGNQRARHLVARSSLTGFAALIAAFGLLMFGLAAYFALERIVGLSVAADEAVNSWYLVSNCNQRRLAPTSAIQIESRRPAPADPCDLER
jgi:hypothetical protein